MPGNLESLDSEMQDCIDDFQNAVFGEEVRSALIRAIEICYEKVIEQVVDHVLTGKSAYELAQDNGYEGGLADWLASLKGDPGPQGPTGPQGPPGRIEGDGFSIDNTIDANSTNPVQNKVIKEALDEKLDASLVDVPSGQNKVILCVNNAGVIKPTGVKAGGNNFSNTPGTTLLATEPAVKNYTYSKIESDSRYLTQHQDISGKANSSDVYTKTQADERYVKRTNVDQFIDSNSTNPVQNRVIADELNRLPRVVDDQLLLNSTNPVQNRVITNALNNVANIDTIWTAIDEALSFENPDSDFDGQTWFPANGLFVERFYDPEYPGVTESTPSKYRYFLSYIDSDAPAIIDPTSSHWHRIIDLTEIFESKQWICQDVSSLPSSSSNVDITEMYYPSVKCMLQYVGELEARVTALENANSQ